jgi:hypothetical protein
MNIQNMTELFYLFQEDDLKAELQEQACKPQLKRFLPFLRIKIKQIQHIMNTHRRDWNTHRASSASMGLVK